MTPEHRGRSLSLTVHTMFSLKQKENECIKFVQIVSEQWLKKKKTKDF